MLKNMGRLEGALQACQDAITRFPDEVVLRNGQAGVLKKWVDYKRLCRPMMR